MNVSNVSQRLWLPKVSLSRLLHNLLRDRILSLLNCTLVAVLSAQVRSRLKLRPLATVVQESLCP